MTKLVKRTRELSSQIRLLAGSQTTDQEAQRFETRANELSETAESIHVPARRLEILAAMAIEVETDPSTSRRLKGVIDDMRAKYEAEPTSIIEADSDWRLITRKQLAKLGNRATAQLMEAWEAFVLAKRPDIAQVHISDWKSSPAYEGQARAIEERLAEFDQMAQHLPSSQEDLERPERLATEIREYERDLPTEFPEPVSDLFIAIRQGTATAEHLTDDALEWLRENGQLQSLRISWGAD